MKNFSSFSFTSRRWLAGFVAAALALSAAVTTTAAAGGKWHDDERGERRAAKMAERLADRMADRLDLTDEQENALVAVFEKRIKKMRALHEKRHENMRALWTRSSLSEGDIRAALAEHRDNHEAHKNAMREERLSLMAETLAEVHAILTPAQREAAAEKFGHHALAGVVAGDMHGGYGRHGGYGKHGKGHCGKHRKGWFRGWFN